MTKKSHENKYKNDPENSFFVSQAELDFHILDHFDSFEIEKMLNEFLEECYIKKFDQVIVIVGKGAVVKPYVTRLLKQHKLVSEFKQASYYNGQSGAFEVNLLNN
ncbi:MAG: Smr/MutS family protein [Candidatus Dojkabacteria bacterium]